MTLENIFSAAEKGDEQSEELVKEYPYKGKRSYKNDAKYIKTIFEEYFGTTKGK